MSTVSTPSTTAHEPPRPGLRLWLHHARLIAPDGAELIGDVSTSIEPGELVAIIGESGAGKSTLLDLLAGNVVPTSGHVRVNGIDSHRLAQAERRRLGFVPQVSSPDALPLATSLFYDARLRLPSGTSAADAHRSVQEVLARVHLDGSGHVPVTQLSGGQQRRASIAVELLTDPDALLLDEPTSGLDPSIAASIASELRSLADGGRTVVFTTHHPDDLEICDRIIAVSPGGRVAFDGTVAEAAALTGSDDVHRIHRTLTASSISALPGIPRSAGEPVPDECVARCQTPADRLDEPAAVANAVVERSGPRLATQWLTLSGRTLAGIRHNRLTAGIMLGAPAAIIGMFAVLFRTDSFDPSAASVTPAIMIAFWVAFAGFFFGLTYGLLQVCPEIEGMRRDRRAGVPAGLQILAKMTALGPILVVINTAMLVVLRLLGRVPALDAAAMGRLSVTLALDALAALALGLLVSALVRTPVQTSLALPMLCFPAVLFAGAMVPVDAMTTVGRAFSAVIPVRWAFDSVGQALGLPEFIEAWSADRAPSAVGSAWQTSTVAVWLILVAFTIVFLGGAVVALTRRVRATARLAR